jgi:hypothetical protein
MKLEKKGLIRQFLKNVFLNCHISTNRFQPTPNQNIKGFLKLSYLVYSQIWLNPLVDGHQIGYITKLKEKPYLHFLLLAIFFHFSTWKI